MNRFKFLSALLLLTVATLFAVRFAFYPVSSFFLDIYGIKYDFSKISLNFEGTLSLENFSLTIDKVLDFKAEKISAAIDRKPAGMLKKEFVLKKIEIINSQLSFDSNWLLEPSDITFPETLPFFPLELVNIKNLQIVAMIDEKTGFIGKKISVSGNEYYKLEMPDNKVFHKTLKENIFIKLSSEIQAKEFFYAIENISVTANGISLMGKKSNKEANLSGSVFADLKIIAELFGEKAKGEIFIDYALNISEKTPEIDATVSVSNLFYEEFRPWDIHAYLKITPSKMFIDRLNMFHNGKVFLSLDGVFPFKEKRIAGVARLFRFDLDDCLRRMTTSGLVNLIVSGKADYIFSTETLSADAKVDLIVNEFDVDKKEILNFPRDVFVAGNVTISSSGVKLHDAIVKTKNETSRLVIKDSWFGFADSMKFHIPVIPGSWINLEDIKTITGFEVKGRGAIEALVTSFYENPYITGKFSGNGCSFHGFNADSCSINTKLENFVLDIGITEIKQKTISSKNSSVSLNFNDDSIPVSFLINDAKGSIKDAATVFDIQTDAFTGFAALTAEGIYKNGMSKLNAFLKVDNLKIKGVKAADSIVFKINDKDPSLISGSGSITYGKSSIKIDGTMTKKELQTDLSASFSSFFKEDFPFLQQFHFEEPLLDIKLSGTLSEPDVSASLKVEKISVSEVKLGDLSISAALEGSSMNFSSNGKLGKSIVFSATMNELNPEYFSASVKVNNFIHKISDLFVKVSLDTKIEGEHVNARISTLMFEKAGFFVRNISPFSIKGSFDNLEIEKTYFDGETANFFVAGKLLDFSPDIKIKGTAFPRMIEMLYPEIISGVDGKFYFDFDIIGKNINGEFRVVDGSYRLKNPLIVFNGFNGAVSLNNNRWKIENFQGFAGGGKIVLKGQGNLFPFDDISMNLKLVNLTGKYALTGDFGLSANVDIIMFNPEQISASGDIELRNIVYNQPLSLDSDFIKLISRLGKKKAGAEIEKSFPIDLNLKVTGKNNIRIATNLIESDLFIDTKISGTTQNPDISGTILLKKGKIQYKQNDFSITRGIITFEEGSGIKPYVDLESFRNVTTKVAEDEKEFKIIMSATGYPLEGEMDISFDSIPQLDPQQLVSLLLWGNIGDSFSGDLAIAAVTDIMGITSEVRKNFNLSKFELIPKYSELDDKTILKLVAEKELYKNLFLMLESNPSDATDQIIELKYKTINFETILGWKNRDRLENSFGALGFDFKLEYIFE